MVLLGMVAVGMLVIAVIFMLLQDHLGIYADQILKLSCSIDIVCSSMFEQGI